MLIYLRNSYLNMFFMLFEIPLNIIWFVVFCYSNMILIVSWHFRFEIFQQINGILLTAGCVYLLYVCIAFWSYLAEHEHEFSGLTLLHKAFSFVMTIARILFLTMKTYAVSIVILPLGIFTLILMMIDNRIKN